jgi:hypothetical protein
MGILYVCGCNLFYLSSALVIVTWADALHNDSLEVSGKFLEKYRWVFLALVAERFLVNVPLAALAAADFGGNSYLPLYRAYCTHKILARDI